MTKPVSIRRWILPSLALAGTLAVVPGCGGKSNAPATPAPGRPVDPLAKAGETAPEWKPKPELTATLSDRTVDIGRYRLKLPTGYEPQGSAEGAARAQAPPMARIKGPPQPDGREPAFVAVYSATSQGVAPQTLDNLANGLQNEFKRLNTDVKVSEPEVGRLANVAFVRFRWSGVDKEKPESKTQGLAYAAHGNGGDVQFYFTTSADDATGMEAAETAILSVVLLDPPAPGAFKGKGGFKGKGKGGFKGKGGDNGPPGGGGPPPAADAPADAPAEPNAERPAEPKVEAPAEPKKE